MMFNFSSISKSLDKERLPKKKIELLINFLEQKKMSPHFFLIDKTLLVSSKKSNFSIRENLDFNLLFSNNETLEFSRVLKHLKSNLFNDSKVELLQELYKDEEFTNLLALSGPLERIARLVSDVNQQRNAIIENKSFSKEQKRFKIDLLEGQLADLFKQLMDEVDANDLGL